LGGLGWLRESRSGNQVGCSRATDPLFAAGNAKTKQIGPDDKSLHGFGRWLRWQLYFKIAKQQAG